MKRRASQAMNALFAAVNGACRAACQDQLAGECALVGDGAHIGHLRRTFPGLSVDTGCRRDQDLVLLAFVNRSGSTHLGQLLASAPDLYGFREDLIHSTVTTRCKKAGLGSVSAYVDHIASLGYKPRAAFGIKASAEQVRFVRLAGIDRMFNSVRVVRISRHDRIAQAVSYWMADQTQEWTSRHDACDTDLEYDLTALRGHLKGIQNAEAALDLVLAASPFPVCNVFYEDLVADRMATVQTIRQALGLPPTDQVSAGWAKRQKSAEKQAFTDRFRRDLERCWFD